MGSILGIEQAASRLRRQLRTAQLPELRLICGLRFFAQLEPDHDAILESYVREFVPSLAESANKSDPREFLPKENELLSRLIELLKKQRPGVVSPRDMFALEQLHNSIRSAVDRPLEVAPTQKRRTCVTCLFVEYYPDLNLPPRGRLLNLYVTAGVISPKAESDDIVVRNPTYEPDDRFLAQARDSVKAARAYMLRRYSLSSKKKYRFDFAVDSTGVRFTGDSLGVAFAVSAIAALAGIEIFRERLSLSPDVAFSGALSPDGELAPIDAEALKLKIYRAFHSGVSFLVIPREHITDAWAYVSELETHFPDRKLELVGADKLDAVVADPRLVSVERSSLPVYITRKALKARRSAWIEVPALIVLMAILFYLIAPPRYMPWFDLTPAYVVVNVADNSLDVFNHDSLRLWVDTIGCPLTPVTPEQTCYHNQVHDLDGDGRNEVLFLPSIDQRCEQRGWLFCYSYDGKLMFQRYCAIPNEFPGDTAGVQYDVGQVNVVEVGGKPIIITEVTQQLPARSHIRIWDTNGDSLGWYINCGASKFTLAKDIDSDGAEELFFMTFNNRMGCATLLVLSADSALGVSPPYKHPYRDLSWIKQGSQLGYVLFPVTDVGKICLPTEYNSPGVDGIREHTSGLFDVYIDESPGPFQASIIYTFDNRLRIVKVSPTDIFWKRRDDLVKEDKLPPVDHGKYQARLRDTVTYWTDSGWVSEGQLRASEDLK